MQYSPGSERCHLCGVQANKILVPSLLGGRGESPTTASEGIWQMGGGIKNMLGHLRANVLKTATNPKSVKPAVSAFAVGTNVAI